MGYIQPEFFTNIFEINIELNPYCIIYDFVVFRDSLEGYRIYPVKSIQVLQTDI